jgi:hypothetical protein
MAEHLGSICGKSRNCGSGAKFQIVNIPVEFFVGEANVLMLTGQTTKNYNEIKSYIAVFLGTENAFDETPIIGLAYTVIKKHSHPSTCIRSS